MSPSLRKMSERNLRPGEIVDPARRVNSFLAFYHSEDYKKAKVLRDGAAQFVAIDGIPAS